MTKGKYQKFNMRLIHQKRSIYNKRVKLNEKLNINPMNSYNIGIHVSFPNCRGGFV